MKAIMMSINPKWVAKILNGEKTIEIRKKFPTDYVGWVYIYCTQGQGLVFDREGKGLVNSKLFPYAKNCPEHDRLVNGKVVARFWCDKVEEIIFGTTLYNDLGFFTGGLHDFELYKQSCLTKQEMHNYLKVKPNGLSGYAIHITKLEIFDKPKEISEFKPHCNYPTNRRLTRAPQSYCFIEI